MAIAKMDRRSKTAVIRIMLIDAQGQRTYLACDQVPTDGHIEYQCSPSEAIPPHYALEVAREAIKGRVTGLTAGYRWYRQAG
jgi:hypothetical protein